MDKNDLVRRRHIKISAEFELEAESPTEIYKRFSEMLETLVDEGLIARRHQREYIETEEILGVKIKASDTGTRGLTGDSGMSGVSGVSGMSGVHGDDEQ